MINKLELVGYQIDAPHFCAGLEVEENTVVIGNNYYKQTKVIRMAPILWYMKGWSINRVIEYILKKNWKIRYV